MGMNRNSEGMSVSGPACDTGDPWDRLMNRNPPNALCDLSLDRCKYTIIERLIAASSASSFRVMTCRPGLLRKRRRFCDLAWRARVRRLQPFIQTVLRRKMRDGSCEMLFRYWRWLAEPSNPGLFAIILLILSLRRRNTHAILNSQGFVNVENV